MYEDMIDIFEEGWVNQTSQEEFKSLTCAALLGSRGSRGITSATSAFCMK